MTFSEIEAARVKKALDVLLQERRPPPHLRKMVDLSYRIKGHSVELYELHPKPEGKPGELMERPVAKARYYRSRDIWRVYWLRQDLKWHSYEPTPEVASPDSFCRVVNKDEYGCFFG